MFVMFLCFPSFPLHNRRDAVVDPWIAKFLKKLTKMFPPSPTPKVPPAIRIPPPLSTPDIEDLSSLPLQRFSAQSPLSNRLRKTPTARATPRSTHSPHIGGGTSSTPVRSPMSFGSDLLCDTCHLDRQRCSYECLSGGVLSSFAVDFFFDLCPIRHSTRSFYGKTYSPDKVVSVCDGVLDTYFKCVHLLLK